MFSQAITLVLALAYAWGRNQDGERIQQNLLEILTILRARADHGGKQAFFTHVIRWVDSSQWQFILLRIRLEHDQQNVPEEVEEEALEVSMCQHFEAQVQEYLNKLRSVAAKPKEN